MKIPHNDGVGVHVESTSTRSDEPFTGTAAGRVVDEVRYRVLSTRAIVMWSVLLPLVGAGAMVLLLLGFTGENVDADRLRLDTIRTTATILVGTGGIAALLLAARRQRSAEIALKQKELDQADVARAFALQERVAAATEADAAARRITDLYTRAAEQLGSDKAPVRLAGLYALERLAQNHHDQRQAIVNVLCAYLRMPYTVPGDPPANDVDDTVVTAHRERVQEREVRVTAQRILSAHLRPGTDLAFWRDIDLDLTHATLVDVDLDGCAIRGARFGAATFSGDTQFTGTTFSGDARFDGATFGGEVRFSAATFTGTARFGDATFTSGAWFDGVDFADLACFDGAIFRSQARFGRATFTGNAGFEGTNFEGVAEFNRASFAGSVAFDDATFTGDASYDDATFTDGAVFCRAGFAGIASFREATFDSAKIDEATFDGDAWFDEVTFRSDAKFGATFNGEAGFRGATFEGDAWFDGAVFTGNVLFRRATFDRWAYFTGARFTEAIPPEVAPFLARPDNAPENAPDDTPGGAPPTGR